MSGWQFDDKLFVEEVLKPIRDGWSPEEDLFRVYQLPYDVTDAQLVTRALDEVNRQFTNQRYRGFRAACELLRARHSASAAVLTDTLRRDTHHAKVAERSGKLAESLRQRLHGAPGLPSAEIAALARSSKGAFTRTTIRAALAGIGARELDPVDLPPSPEPGQWTDARTQLTQLRHGSLWDYLTEVLNGPATAAADLSSRRGALRVSRNAESTAETTVLKLIEQWITAAELVAVLRYEALAALAGKAHFGYAEVARAAAALSDRLPRLGLPEDPDATAYAAWCAHRATGGTSEPGWQEDYREAVRGLQLRGALAVLNGQPALPEEWRKLRDDLVDQLSFVDTELTRCRALERTDVEAAVAGYHRLRQRLADQEIDTAIERCRPAAPRSAKAEVRDGRIVVSWPSSTSTTGRIGYRVTRADTVVCEETGGCEAVDQDPPGGTPLGYAIHTLRDGNPSARAARTGQVTVLREVLNLELRGEPDAISGRWRLPDGASGATVSRAGTVLAGVSSTVFVDKDVRPGRSYDYLVRARYRLADGAVAHSDGVHATASCQEVPAGVTDLVAEADGDELLARWTPPPKGDVQLLELRAGEEPPEPDVVTVAVAKRYGPPVSPTGPSGRGRLRGRIRTSGQRQVLLPVTVLGELAAIGTAYVVDRRQGSVRGLTVRRLGSTVELTWEWPDGASAARVVWRTSAKPTGPTDPEASYVDITKVGYDSRGVSVPVPEGEHWFGVCTALFDGTVHSFGPLVFRRESTTATARYAVERAGWRRHRVLVVEGDPGRELPPVVLTAKSGSRPMGPRDGVEVLRMDGGVSPIRAEFAVPAQLLRPVHLRAYSLDERVVLVASRPSQLVLS